MELYKKIRKLARNKTRSSNWWTDMLMNELMEYQKKNFNEIDTNFITPGDFVFFLYSAKYPQKYRYWDQHPLVYVMDVNPRGGTFFGANIHYLNPSYRGAVAQSFINKEGMAIAPKKTLKQYLFGNVSTQFFKVPESEWKGVALLPTDKFVDKRGQFVSSFTVWDYPDNLSSP